MSNAFVVTECKPEPQISTKLLKSRLRHPETPDAGASKDQTLRNLQVKLGLRFQWVYPTSFLRAAHQRPGIPTTQPGKQNSIFAFPFKIIPAIRSILVVTLHATASLLWAFCPPLFPLWLAPIAGVRSVTFFGILQMIAHPSRTSPGWWENYPTVRSNVKLGFWTQLRLLDDIQKQITLYVGESNQEW